MKIIKLLFLFWKCTKKFGVTEIPRVSHAATIQQNSALGHSSATDIDLVLIQKDGD